MNLTCQAISDFRSVYKKRFGVDLPDDEAQEKFLDLLRFVKIMTHQVSNNNNKNKYAIQTS